MHLVVKRVTRWLVRFAALFLPAEKARALEQWHRGREEFRKRRLADFIVVSYPKSGRTWLRVLVSRYYQLAYDLPEHYMLGFDNFHKMNRAVPRIFFTHDNYLRHYTGNRDTKRDFYDEKVVLLVRRPQDVAVSQYFQWKYRMRPRKKNLNRYPAHGSEVTPYDFVMNPQVGLPAIVEFMNGWASELPRIKNLLVVRYDDMREKPEENLKRIVEFLGMPPKSDHIDEAVRFASLENLRQMESKDFFWRSGSRLTPRDRTNPDSYKVRRAKVGGYRDYFDDEELARIDALVQSSLSPVFGYAGTGTQSETDTASHAAPERIPT